MNTKIIPITEKTKVGWTVRADGIALAGMKQLTIENPAFGCLTYGAHSSGAYDTWAFHEIGGGGAVTIPFAFIDGKLWIGVLSQNRPLQSDQPVLNVPRGFLDPGETHFQAAVRETAEELHFAMGNRVFPLPGEPGNPNSTFFETWDKRPDGDPEGVRYCAVEFLPGELVRQGDGWVIKPDILVAREKDKVEEGILKSSFIPWMKAVTLGDHFTGVATARLVVNLAAQMQAKFKEGFFSRIGQWLDELFNA